MGYKNVRDKLLQREGVKLAYDLQRELLRLGQLLQRARATSKLRQEDLTRETGINQSDISRIEHGLGKKGPTFETLVRLAHAQDMELVIELVPRNKKNQSSATPKPPLQEAF